MCDITHSPRRTVYQLQGERVNTSTATRRRFLWGRGAIDMKSAIIAQLEALSELHRRSVRPKRTILLAIGHDEEVGGPTGATQIAARLAAEGRRVALVWDEGMVVLSDGLGALVRSPVALIGTSEKVHCAVDCASRGNCCSALARAFIFCHLD